MTIIKQYNSGTAQWEAIAVGQVGATGPGVAAGGTTNQILTKVSNADFDTQWVSTIDASVLYDNSGSTLSSTLVQTAIDELDSKKLDTSSLTSSVTFFPTNAASDIGGYGKLVTSTADSDYNTVAVNINTGTFSGTDNLVGSLASTAGVLEGNTTPINVTVIGQVRRVTGNSNDSASFYFEVYKRDSGNTETLIGTSDNTTAVSSASYEEFSATALITDTEFTETDRVVLKFYADVVEGPGGRTYDFQYGGNTPVRALFPVPVTVIPQINDAEDIIVDASGFSGLLSGTDDDVQQALSTLDSVTKTEIGLGNVDNVSSSDLRDRSTHTGTQTLSTISDAGTIASQDANSVNIDGGNIDGTPIGVNSADEGNFTTLDASGDVNFDSGTLFVDASANSVGIGTTINTTTPSTLLVSNNNNTNHAISTKMEVSGSGTHLNNYDSSGNLLFRIKQNTEDGNAILEAKNDFVIEANSQEAMRIDSSGNVLIGKTSATNIVTTDGVQFNPAGGIFATRTSEVPCLIARQGTDGSLIRFYAQGSLEGSISVSGSTVSYNGGHLARWSRLPSGKQDASILKGTVMTNLDAMVEWEGEDNEQLNQMAVSSVEGDPNVSGVFVNWDNDDDWNDINIAMTGDMIIRIGAGVTVQRGDLLMSAGDGTAKPQGDDVVKSKTIAKVTSTHVTCTYDDGSYCVPCVLMAC